MKNTYTILFLTCMVALFLPLQTVAQESGDYRSAANGDWSAAATWEVYDGSAWNAADAAPDGSESVTVLNGDTVTVAADLTISGHLTVEGNSEGEPPFTGGVVEVSGSTLTFADGSVYQHDRNEGDMPVATWESGSTVMITGAVTDEPDDIDQAFHHFVWNNPNQVENISVGWNDYTLGGNLTVLSSNGNQFRLSSAGDEGDPARSITIMGDVMVDGENSEFTATGSGDIFDYNITVMGDVTVQNEGFLSVSRGSGGRAVWTLHGDLTVDNGELGESEIGKHGQKKTFVFAGAEAQTVMGNEVDTESELYYEVNSGSSVTFSGEFPVDSLTANGDIILEGELVANGAVVLNGGTMTVADGGTYTHGYDEGEVPEATWEMGSTVKLTGIVTNDPDGLDQDFYNFTWDNEGQIENINIGWNDYTLEGDLTVLNTNGQQFRLSSAGDEGDPARSITIMGDVWVDGENTEFTATGSGDIFDYNVSVMGDLTVSNDAYLAVSRGSGGRAVWTLHGDFTVDKSRIGESDIDKHGQMKTFVFAGSEPQTVTGDSVETNSTLFYEINSGSSVMLEGTFPVDSLTVMGDLSLNGELVADGQVVLMEGATMTVTGSGAYNHSFDAGTVPIATWEDGSTVMFTGIETSAPETGGQDFYNIVVNSPDNINNNDLGLNGATIGGNIDILETGEARIYLTNPDSFEDHEITIMGDIYMNDEGGAFASNGTGSGESSITIHHYGNITVDGGNFSISRGSGPLVYWNMYEGDFTFNAGETQNSNPRVASAFIFKGDSTYHRMNVSADVEIQHLPVVVDTGAILDIGMSSFDNSSDIFEVRAGSWLASSDTVAFDSNVDSDMSFLSQEAGYIINGSVAQETGFGLPLTIASLTIDNEEGVLQSRGITVTDYLKLSSGVFDNTIGFTLSPGAEIIYDGGSLLIPVSNEDEPDMPQRFALDQNYPNPFNPTTTIQFDVPEASDVQLRVYDMTGRLVAELVNGRKSAGTHTVNFNADNLASGMYLYRLTAGDFSSVRKLTLIK